MKPGIKTRLVILLCFLCVSQTYCRAISSATTTQRQSKGSNTTANPTKATSATLTERSTSSASETLLTTQVAATFPLSVTPAVINKPSQKATRATPRKSQPVSKVSPPPSRSTVSSKYVSRTASVSANVLNSSLSVPVKQKGTVSPSVASKSSSKSSAATIQKSSASTSVSVSNDSKTAGANASSNSSNMASVNDSNVPNQTESTSSVPIAATTTVVSTLSTTGVTTETVVEITEPPVTEAIEIEETEPPTDMPAFTITEEPEFEETEPPTIAESQVTEIPEVEETEPPTPGEGEAGGSEGQTQGPVSTGEAGLPIKAEAKQAIADQNAKGSVKVRSVNSPVSGQGSEPVEVEELEATG